MIEWNKHDTEIVEKYYHKKTSREIKEMLETDRTIYGIHGKARSLGLAEKSNSTKKKIEKARNNPLEWSDDIAYLVGLIASDGTMVKDRPRIHFTTTDKELLRHVKKIIKNQITGREYKPTKYKEREAFKYQFTSRRFYYFLEKVGLTPNKSLSIGGLDIPDKYFPDFFRGEFDGDGTVRKDAISIKIYSASHKFLEWLKNKTAKLFDITEVNIISNKDSAVLSVEWWKEDTKKIFKKIYNGGPYLSRKKKAILKMN